MTRASEGNREINGVDDATGHGEKKRFKGNREREAHTGAFGVLFRLVSSSPFSFSSSFGALRASLRTRELSHCENGKCAEIVG